MGKRARRTGNKKPMDASTFAKRIKLEAVKPKEMEASFVAIKNIKQEVVEGEEMDATAFLQDIKLEVDESESMDASDFLANIKQEIDGTGKEEQYWKGPRDIFPHFNDALQVQLRSLDEPIDATTNIILGAKKHHMEFMAAALLKKANGLKYHDQMTSPKRSAGKQEKRPQNNLAAAMSRYKKDMMFTSNCYTGMYLMELNERIQKQTEYWTGVALAERQMKEAAEREIEEESEMADTDTEAASISAASGTDEGFDLTDVQMEGSVTSAAIQHESDMADTDTAVSGTDGGFDSPMASPPAASDDLVEDFALPQEDEVDDENVGDVPNLFWMFKVKALKKH